MTSRVYKTQYGYDLIIRRTLYHYEIKLVKIGTVDDRYKSGRLLKKVPGHLKNVFYQLQKK